MGVSTVLVSTCWYVSDLVSSHTHHRIFFHTDLTYYDYMPGTVFLHCIVQVTSTHGYNYYSSHIAWYNSNINVI